MFVAGTSDRNRRTGIRFAQRNVACSSSLPRHRVFYFVSLTSQQALGQEKREQHVAKDKRFLPSLISFHSLKGIHTINITRAARGVT